MRHVNDHLRADLDGELPPAEAQAVSGHLAGCPACAADLAHLRMQTETAAAYLSDAGPASMPGARCARALPHDLASPSETPFLAETGFL